MSTSAPEAHIPRVHRFWDVGWVDTHVQRKIVVRQLHTMPNSVLQSSIFLQELEVVASFAAGTGKALAEKTWTRKRRSISSCAGE
jgi:hypothetical protein